MKISFIAKGNEVSNEYKNAEKLVTIITSTNQKDEEKITAKNGMDLIGRINEIMPKALILGWAGPSIKFLDSQIEVYEANTGDKIDDVLKLYNQGKLQKYVANFPDDACPGDCDKCDH